MATWTPDPSFYPSPRMATKATPLTGPKLVVRNRGRAAGTVAVVLASVLPAAPAAAVDGEVLINQAKAIAGGITPGDAPGFPITISRLGKYKLTSTLNVPPGTDGIVITSNDVAIDFNGFTMGGGSQARNGIAANGRGSITAMNGTIVAFTGLGISNNPGVWAVVENMRVLGNGVGMRLGRPVAHIPEHRLGEWRRGRRLRSGMPGRTKPRHRQPERFRHRSGRTGDGAWKRHSVEQVRWDQNQWRQRLWQQHVDRQQQRWRSGEQ
jgi:hypothetical protein